MIAEKFNFAGGMGRILAIDYGTKRTGVAVSDPERIIAGGLETVPTPRLMAWLEKYIACESVDIVVVGRPLKTDGSASDTLAEAASLAGRIAGKFPGVKVTMFDERFTSVLAHRAMIDGGMKRMQRRDKAAVDRISATILLQGFMESRLYREMIENE